MKTNASSSALAGLFALVAMPGLCCSCDSGSISRALREGDAIFLGDLIKSGNDEVTLRVVEVFSGLPSSTREVTSEIRTGGPCPYNPYERGTRFLTVARRTATGKINGGGACTLTRRAEAAAASIRILRFVASNPKRNILAGVVWSRSGGAVTGAAVTARRETGGGIYRAVTKADGTFEFHDLPSDVYVVSKGTARPAQRVFLPKFGGPSEDIYLY